MPDDYLTSQEVADLLGCHPKTVRRQIAFDVVPAYKVGQRLPHLPVHDASATAFSARLHKTARLKWLPPTVVP